MISPEKKAKIMMQCRRGMLELDILLAAFLKVHMETLSENDVVPLEELLNLDDPSLYELLLGLRTFSLSVEQKNLVERIRSNNKF